MKTFKILSISKNNIEINISVNGVSKTIAYPPDMAEDDILKSIKNETSRMGQTQEQFKYLVKEKIGQNILVADIPEPKPPVEEPPLKPEPIIEEII